MIFKFFLFFNILNQVKSEVFSDLEVSDCMNNTDGVYKFEVRDLKLETQNLSNLKGKITLISNVATFSKNTDHYLAFKKLKDEFKGKGENDPCTLEIICFPCHQFGMQEPANNHELLSLLKYVNPGKGFEPNFPIYAKLNVNGEEEHPLFRSLKDGCPSKSGLIAHQNIITWKLIRNNDISWNFEKFIVDHNGKPVRRYMPDVNPERLRDDIKLLIEQFQSLIILGV